MPSYKEAFPSKFFRAEDVTSPIVAAIERVGYEDVGVGADQQRKLVVRLAGHAPGVVLNLTRGDAIAEITATVDYTKWPGHVIELFQDWTTYQGRRVPCLGVRKPSQPVPSPTTGTPPDSVPAWVTEPEEAERSGRAGMARDIDEAMPESPVS